MLYWFAEEINKIIKQKHMKITDDKIKEHLDKGGKIRCKNWKSFVYVTLEREYKSFFIDERNVKYNLSANQIFLDDWEITEEPVKITRAQLAEAWNKRVASATLLKHSYSSGIFYDFCQSLGL
jgi:hypothetical protein